MNVAKGIKGFVSSPLADRFWSKVNKTKTCWLWTGANDGRYGIVWLDGKKHKAHRVAWLLCHGEDVPPGLAACHHCDVPACVRPDHLFVGTKQDNMRDSIAKGRFVFHVPETSPRCKRGHELTGANVYRYPEGSHHRNKRICLACKDACAALAGKG